jgi:hypothetical protein
MDFTVSWCALPKILSPHLIYLRNVGFNMKDKRSRSTDDCGAVNLLNRFRRLIETVIGQLCERFNFEKVRARDMWHLTSRLNRKLLAHTVCVWLNRHSLNPLQFEQLLSIEKLFKQLSCTRG